MKTERNYISKDLILDSKDKILVYFEELKNRAINSEKDLYRWWKDRSETNAFLEEDMAWRYIKMSCNTSDDNRKDNFHFFVNEIQPVLQEYSDILDKKLINSKYTDQLSKNVFEIPLKKINRSIELFRKENIPVFTELQKKEREFGTVTGAMTVTFRDEEMTLQKASNFLKDTDRTVRKDIFERINTRRIKDSETLNKLLDKLITLRHKAATNAGFDNYRDYMHASLNRFDYSTDDCIEFHNSIKKTVLPIIKQIHKERKLKLGYDVLKPYDTSVDPSLKEALKPFNTSDELIDNSIEVFSSIRTKYGEYLKIMKDNSYLDLDSRKNKAPGGFNYPLYESNIPFIFMNATGNQRDLETMMHEGGHAIHSFLSSDLELVDFKALPSEVAELASMSMELISSSYWNVFYDDSDDLIGARRSHLEGVLSVLPWIATIDKFQHQLYVNPNHNHDERIQMWMQISNEFRDDLIDWAGYEKFLEHLWQRQLHIFEVPFYYIEYGIAQLGAVAVWKNYKEDPEKALDMFENALRLGYSKSIPEIYQTAGIQFDFSESYIADLMNFVYDELKSL